jgi:nitrite reductase (NADH) small subunit
MSTMLAEETLMGGAPAAHTTWVAGTPATDWHPVCPLADLDEAWGEAALVAGQQVALFRAGDQVFAVSHTDPATSANVMARGIVGSRGSRSTIASPLHKQVYDLQTGECLGEPSLQLAVFAARVHNGFVEVSV